MQRTDAGGEVGAVALGTGQVYAYIERTAAAGGWRVRLGLDEYDALGLHPFQWVRVGLPRRGVGVLFFAGVREQPPFVWLEFRPAQSAR
jgi:hypothetical protein